jgi:hypothetical protein
MKKKSVKKKVKKIVIQREKWLHGTSKVSIDGELLDVDGNMCCLGFYLNQCGVPKANLRFNKEPCDVFVPKQARWLVKNSAFGDFQANSEVTSKLVELNDMSGVRDRERRIASIFKKHNVEVVFK